MFLSRCVRLVLGDQSIRRWFDVRKMFFGVESPPCCRISKESPGSGGSDQPPCRPLLIQTQRRLCASLPLPYGVHQGLQSNYELGSQKRLFCLSIPSP